MLTLDEVRKEIDRVDGEIKKLFVERMGLADRVVQIKAGSGDTIYKPDREAAIIEKQSAGLDEALVMEYRALVKRMMMISREYQYGRMLELRGGFPYAYVTEEPKIRSLAMLADEISVNGCDSGTVMTVDDYEEMGRRIIWKEADAGRCILEDAEGGVNDELNQFLVSKQLYVYQGEIQDRQGIRQKAVTFGRELVVRKAHNRLKAAFVCPNVSGALSSVLSTIADYDINLREIHSVPFREAAGWKYRFFVELELNLLEKTAQSLIYQLSQEAEDFQLMGSYYCRDE